MYNKYKNLSDISARNMLNMYNVN